MYVCLCRAVTEADIDAALAEGAFSASEVIERSGASTGCGGCQSALLRVLVLRGLAVDEGEDGSHERRARQRK